MIDCSIYALPPAQWQAKIDALSKTPPACATVQQKCPGAFQMGGP
jgi:hypothetical protein